MKKELAILFLCFLVLGCVSSNENMPKETDVCTKENTQFSMTFSEAKSIAEKSTCMEEGDLEETAVCNEITGTWWINLDSDRAGCSPACVINVETKTAEVNYRCTGLIK